ncbi:MAG: hypothetical protein KKI08_21895, partial [Armatimonadetes bacterium]|nr:hypothetical protein [Armatimonadota bacterium]
MSLEAKLNPNIANRVVVDVNRATGAANLGWLDVEAATHAVVGLHTMDSKEWVDCRKTKFLQIGEAEEVARQFLGRHWPSVVGEYSKVASKPQAASEGRYEFEWQLVRHEVFAASIVVQIRAWEPKVIGFRYSVRFDPSKITPVRYTRDQVADIVRRAVASKLRVPEDKVEPHISGRTAADASRERATYYWQASARVVSGQRTAWVYTHVGDADARVGPLDVQWESRSAPKAPLSAEYAWPVWMSSGKQILAEARLAWHGYPPWDEDVPVSTVLTNASGERSAFLRPIPEMNRPRIWYRAPAQGGRDNEAVSVLGYASGEVLCRMDLDTGQFATYRVTGLNELPDAHPVCRGDVCCFAGFGVGDQLDLKAVRFSTTEKVLPAMSLPLPGQDTLPQFIPGSQTLVFAHGPQPTDGIDAKWQIMATTLSQAIGFSPPKVIAEGLPAILRLSVFPSGDRLLVSHAGGLDIVEVGSGSRKSLAIPPLRDPEGSQYLRMEHPTIDPSGKLIVFRALHQSDQGQGTRGYILYVCGLDGSQLRRITPLDGEDVDPY